MACENIQNERIPVLKQSGWVLRYLLWWSSIHDHRSQLNETATCIDHSYSACVVYVNVCVCVWSLQWFTRSIGSLWCISQQSVRCVLYPSSATVSVLAKAKCSEKVSTAQNLRLLHSEIVANSCCVNQIVKWSYVNMCQPYWKCTWCTMMLCQHVSTILTIPVVPTNCDNITCFHHVATNSCHHLAIRLQHHAVDHHQGATVAFVQGASPAHGSGMQWAGVIYDELQSVFVIWLAWFIIYNIYNQH